MKTLEQYEIRSNAFGGGDDDEDDVEDDEPEERDDHRQRPAKTIGPRTNQQGDQNRRDGLKGVGKVLQIHYLKGNTCIVTLFFLYLNISTCSATILSA